LSALAVWSEPDYIIQAEPVSVGPLLADPLLGQQYSLNRMAVYSAWDAGATGQGVTVAVVDSGVDFAHPDLAGVFVSRGKDFVNNDDDATDDAGHGTHVAGIIAMRPDNGQGGTGVAHAARILPVKVMGADGNGSHASISQGVTWAADNGARVINLSLGGPYGSQTLEAAVNYATSKGALVIAAAGNHGTTQPAYPAAYPVVVSVCATDQQDQRATYSAYGETVDVCAPGSGIISTVRGGRWQAWDGTSMAAPNAAAVAALIWSRNPTWDAAQVRGALLGSADRVVDVGSGRVNAARGVGAQPGTAPTPAPTSTVGPSDPAVALEALINDYRRVNGLTPFRHDARLRQAGHIHNIWMRDHNCFAHVCPGEPDVMARIRSTGYPVVSGGENIVIGSRTPQEALAAWQASDAHNRALLATYWPDIGCAWLAGVDGAWASCEFALGSEPQPAPQPTSAPIATPTPRPVIYPTPRPPMPPSDRAFLIEVRPDAGWAAWDRMYYDYCNRAGYRCYWPPRSWLPWLSAKDAAINGGDERTTP